MPRFSIIATAVAVIMATAGHAAPAAKEVAEKSSDPGDKMVCKRFIETGSLVKGYRTCKTKREWERERDNLRQVNSAASCGSAGNGIACR